MLGWIKNIEEATLANETFRTVLFTGVHSQLTVMHIEVGSDIGLEVHRDNDQFLRIEQGKAKVEFGEAEDNLTETHDVEDDWAVIVPAGVWHNITNTGDVPLKVYSIYSPAHHPKDTVHVTRSDADAAEASELE